MPAISVIIPVYKGGEAFKECLKALANATFKPEEIIIVADGGWCDSFRPQEKLNAKVIETSLQGGPARARNIGGKSATGDILLFIDADVVVEPDIIQKVRDIFIKDQELMALFGSYDDKPGQTNFLSQYRNLLHHYVHQNAKEDASTFWGACGAIRRDVFLALGGFDEKLYRQPAIEDIELGYRMKQAGYKIRLCKQIQIKHLKRWSAFSILKTDFLQRALPWTDLILRNREFLNDLNLETSSRISVALTFCLFATLLLVIFWNKIFLVIPFIVLFLFFLNIDLYKFFKEKRGLLFMLKSIPWHWLYFFYSGVAFAFGSAKHTLLSFKK